MMKSFEYFCDAAGVDRTAKAPDPVYVYHAYKNGKVMTFDYEHQAREFTQNVERAETEASKKARDEFFDKQNKLYSAATNLWYSHLKAEYAEMNAQVFDLCYSYAYDKSHAWGHDEIASTFENVAELIDNVLRVTK
jgi:hypothetical protein